MKQIKSLFLILALFYSVTFSLITHAEQTTSGITVTDPYIRAIPPGQTNSAMFLGLENNTDKNRSLVKVHSDIAKNIELHEHVHEEGMMKMRQVPKIDIAANGKTILKPGGYHIMLINLNQAIEPGDKFNLTLEFDNKSRQDIVAEVRKLNMGMGNMKCGMKHGMKHGEKHKGMHKKTTGMKAMNKEVMHAMKHANPAPNLMQAVLKMGDQLNLDEKQKATLKKWRDKRGPATRKLALDIMKMEKDIYQASLAGDPEEKIKAITKNLMQARTRMIEGKIKCRDNMRKILTDEQFKKVVSLYRSQHE